MENAIETEREVQFNVKNGAGRILLNRPKALNALSAGMVAEIGEQLARWENDDSVALVYVEGAGEKGLCAGGDMRSFYDKKDDNVEAHALDFFATEYKMNVALHRYPKPILAYMNGIVMGGGIGISIFASERIVTERSKLSMPEMNIGFFPDVGGSYFLNQMPGYTGRYLALTAYLFNGADALYFGAADHYIESAKWDELRMDIEQHNWIAENDVAGELKKRIQTYAADAIPESSLSKNQEKIDAHFRYDSVAEIITSLEKAAHEGDSWADETARVIRSKSPVSMAVALEQVIRGKDKPIADCFRMEMNMSMNFMHSHDFYEGVRSVLVDKDRNPQWQPASIEEVTRESVEAFFKSPWQDENHPLRDL
ncbi:enoyl-CoA hydratase/isomerase family protein [Aneurinibacillus tyrosinisolvens]|uniref:enoyl-CoA hydratase/isomerase family protein n=1 Tax=Aneurinibacillus tyrosinisolvens TaxID=1443435 RepID=UPI000699CA63|nr:enoyl-CoA hydratase/isomerase family protein [Aneurinibacillus tyrosinisolvens]